MDFLISVKKYNSLRRILRNEMPRVGKLSKDIELVVEQRNSLRPLKVFITLRDFPLRISFKTMILYCNYRKLFYKRKKIIF